MANDPLHFKKMVDEVILISELDPDLAENLRWVNSQANQNNISFYQMIFYILHRNKKNIHLLD